MKKSTSIQDQSTYVEHHISRGDYKIYVRDFPGAEPAFVLMHGFPDNLGIYDGLAPILALAGQRVIAFDFLGYGGSDKPREYPYSARNLEGDLEAVLTSLQMKKVIPVGHDASVPTAIDWSLDHQDRVAAVALLNGYYDDTPTLKFPEFINLFADASYRALSTAFINDPQQFGWLLIFQVRQFLKEAPTAVLERIQKTLASVVRGQFGALPNAAPAFLSLTRELSSSLDTNTKRASQLSQLRHPVGLIWGAGDPYLNTGVAEHLKDLFPNAELTLLQSGHWPQIEIPGEVAKSLLALRDRPDAQTTPQTGEQKKDTSNRVIKTSIPHQIVRLDIPVQQSYEELRSQFERAVPMWSRERSDELVERKAPWSEVVSDAAASAPHEFLLYWKLDLAPMMSLAGDKMRATEYLMGNHVIAETMYRHDPSVALYVPLRCAIYETDRGTRFAIEQPSEALSSLGRDEITEVGIDLDRKLARLLTALDVEIPNALLDIV